MCLSSSYAMPWLAGHAGCGRESWPWRTFWESRWWCERLPLVSVWWSPNRSFWPAMAMQKKMMASVRSGMVIKPMVQNLRTYSSISRGLYPAQLVFAILAGAGSALSAHPPQAHVVSAACARYTAGLAMAACCQTSHASRRATFLSANLFTPSSVRTLLSTQAYLHQHARCADERCMMMLSTRPIADRLAPPAASR